MKLKVLDYKLSVCKVKSLTDFSIKDAFYSVTVTDEEISIICKEEDVPDKTIEKSDNWRAFKIEGILDFSLIGILAKIASILAENNIPIFVNSTYNTDYVLIKQEYFDNAIVVLSNNGYEII